MKASEEILSMRWLFNRGDERIARVIALAKRVEALEWVAEAARTVKKHGYCGDDASNLDAAVDILDAQESKR